MLSTKHYNQAVILGLPIVHTHNGANDMNLKFDSTTFEMTAQAVFTMNDAISDQYKDWKELEAFMYSMAYTHTAKPDCAFFSTGGFCLTAFNVPIGQTGEMERHITATLMPYTVHKYLEAQS